MSQTCPDSAREKLAELPAKRRAFVTAYLGEAKRNGTRAAELAGYAHPRTEAQRILGEPVVAEVVEALIAETEAEAIADAEEVWRFLTSVMRGNVSTPMHDLEGNPTETVAPPTMRERLSAASELAKLRGYQGNAGADAQGPTAMPQVSVEEAKAYIRRERGWGKCG